MHECLKLSPQWALHKSYLPVQMCIKRKCAACRMLCFKSGGGLLCTAIGCYDSKLKILYTPFKSRCDALLDGFDHR